LVLYGRDSGHDWPLETEQLGYLAEPADIAGACNRSQIFLCTSRADNLPNTVIEAIACGLPVVAYRVGGLPDMVRHEWNGYLADPEDPVDFARGIEWVLADEDRRRTLGANSRALAEERHEPSVVAAQYADIYQGIMDRQGDTASR
jgi:glycosyltransferase involved in cell wall biosynthesis